MNTTPAIGTDRNQITDTLLRYALCLDAFDLDALGEVLAEDVTFAARFVNLESEAERAAVAPLISGRQHLIRFIRVMTVDLSWQQHTLDVYDVQIAAEHASAITYMTSFKTRRANPGEVVVVVARYRDELRKVGGRWLIGSKRMEVGWTETRQANTSELAVAYAARSREVADAIELSDGDQS